LVLACCVDVALTDRERIRGCCRRGSGLAVPRVEREHFGGWHCIQTNVCRDLTYRLSFACSNCSNSQ